ncbi:hypothetical protein PN419_00225 [Halorubrum ezzemoulense]|uniref:hypothetical protein n=1 Tax=Halorubrum ezzemoulense TaxID=337243 RepID=UPI00232AEB60|nr:hypothetical protein [Halorubrum ezzemoulense]MDB9247432.1 hypothetical protein [Halorubrum ezzemoulense]MDB9258659.1 hypothetical protein [Halorubrum ezzemoulense]MDB9264483.1 hypothetical protein [Halorubrum ezzemoulense]MDB9269020.1 hypothetical protein [Halorubrum ezzemoulense]MDB9271451.1 hypothetical protein [Halorubrum ezzemoulense]
MSNSQRNPNQYDATVSVDTDDARVEGHTFQSAYDAHDIAERHVTAHLEQMGFAVEPWGIDMREDDSVLGDNKMDLKAHQPTQETPNPPITGPSLAGLIEVKTKRSEDWYGVVNRHHFRKYLVQAHDHDVPAYIYMSLLDEDEEQIERDTFIRVEPWDEYGDVLAGEYPFYESSGADQFLRDNVDRHPQIERTFRAPDGQQVVMLDTDAGIDWPSLTHVLYGQ